MVTKNIILLHGWGAESKKLYPLKNNLEKFGWQVLVPKLPGFEAPPPKSIWGLKDYSDYVLKKARKKFGKKRFFVFGHSFGGAIAIKLASENFKETTGVILCATRGVSREKLIKRLFFIILAKMGKIFLLNKRLALGFRWLLYKLAREHDYEKTEGIMREVFKKIISEDIKPLLVKVKIPTLILWGEKDKTTPVKDAYFLHSRLSKSKLITFKNQGHRLPYEEAETLAKEIEKWSTII